MGCSSRPAMCLPGIFRTQGRGSYRVRTSRGNWVSDKNNPRLDYGNVMFDRRHRVLTTFLYQLPFGKGATFLSNSDRLMDAAVGGWQLGGVRCSRAARS